MSHKMSCFSLFKIFRVSKNHLGHKGLVIAILTNPPLLELTVLLQQHNAINDININSNQIIWSEVQGIVNVLHQKCAS